jgi:glutaredoxin
METECPYCGDTVQELASRGVTLKFHIDIDHYHKVVQSARQPELKEFL